jgi:hypothetical protein
MKKSNDAPAGASASDEKARAAVLAVEILAPFELRRLRVQLAAAALPSLVLRTRRLDQEWTRRAVAALAVQIADATLAAVGE